MDFKLIPGWFSESCERVLARLASGSPLRLGAEPDRGFDADRVLSDLERGEGRWQGPARVPGGPPLNATLAIWKEAGGRPLLALCVEPPPKNAAITGKDLELALLGIACAALAKESQGAVLLGQALGPVGAGLERGTVADQVQQLLALHDENIEVIVVPEDTARALPSLLGFEPRRLGNLLELRRV